MAPHTRPYKLPRINTLESLDLYALDNLVNRSNH